MKRESLGRSTVGSTTTRTSCRAAPGSGGAAIATGDGPSTGALDERTGRRRDDADPGGVVGAAGSWCGLVATGGRTVFVANSPRLMVVGGIDDAGATTRGGGG